MKRFEEPMVLATVFAVEDIITASSVNDDEEFIEPEQGENQTPYG